MRNGTSSAVDQTGIPVYRGTHLRTSSLNDKNSSQEHANDHHHNNSSNGTNDDDTNDIKGFNKKNLNLDENTSGHVAKSKIRRSTPWYQSRDMQTITAITALALVVRLWAIGYPTSVV